MWFGWVGRGGRWRWRLVLDWADNKDGAIRSGRRTRSACEPTNRKKPWKHARACEKITTSACTTEKRCETNTKDRPGVCNVHHADEPEKRDTRGTDATHGTREGVPRERRTDPTSSQYARHNAIRREVLKKQQEAADGVHEKEEADAKA